MVPSSPSTGQKEPVPEYQPWLDHIPLIPPGEGTARQGAALHTCPSHLNGHILYPWAATGKPSSPCMPGMGMVCLTPEHRFVHTHQCLHVHARVCTVPALGGLRVLCPVTRAARLQAAFSAGHQLLGCQVRITRELYPLSRRRLNFKDQLPECLSGLEASLACSPPKFNPRHPIIVSWVPLGVP